MNKMNLKGYSLGALCMALMLSGCTTIDPYTERGKTSNATIGTGVGAATGAAVGALVAGSGDRTKGALIGAGVGALAGLGIGHYMDRQEAELRQELRGTGVSVTRYGDEIILNMPSNITFDVGRAEIKDEFYPVLDSVAIVIDKYSRTTVEVEGHTDNSGAAELNQILSEQRAQSVASYLRKRGVGKQRFVVSGYGESRPVASNNTAQGRAENRRVEITLAP